MTIPQATCVVCKEQQPAQAMFSPSQCARAQGLVNSHRICFACWFDPISGFAVAAEHGSHSCPGCSRKPVRQRVVDLVSGSTPETAICIE